MRQDGFEHRRPTGHVGSKTLKIVCSDCNNGWMSKIESDAKPILTDLMLEKAIIMDRDQQLLVAKWAFLKTIIAEYLDITWQAINSSERKYFYEKKLLPENIGIWIVKNETDKWRYRHLHTGGKVHYSSLPNRCNTQSTIFVIGGLIIYIYKRHDSSFTYPFLGEWGRSLTLIYPHEHKAIRWASVPSMNGDETELLRLNLERVLSLLSLPHGI